MGRPKRIEVSERALQVPADIMNDPRFRGRLANPFGEPSAPVALKDKTRQARWFNADIVTDKIWRAKAKGWDPLRPCDIVDTDQIGWFKVNAEGVITRGERGQEVLMSIPKAAYEAIEKAKTAWNNRNMGSASKTRSEVIAAAGEQHGDQAANFLSKAIVNVEDSYERVERRDEME